MAQVRSLLKGSQMMAFGTSLVVPLRDSHAPPADVQAIEKSSGFDNLPRAPTFGKARSSCW